MCKTIIEPVREEKVSSWIELRDILEELADAGWAFRGQADADWPLESSLTRYLTKLGGPSGKWLDRERKVLRTFQRKAHLLLPRTPEPEETLEWLALMQHHGAPTRLLDFTWSPYVAAFFALERATADAAIWAISSGPTVPNFRGFHISKLLNSILSLDLPQAVARENPRKFEEPLPRSAVADAEIPLVVMGEPVLMNQRMTTQAGTFIIPIARIDSTIESAIPSSIFKLRLATQSLRKQTMDRLYNMNISNATLFPGIDGLARSLAFELEFEWAVDNEVVAQRLAPSLKQTPDGTA